MTVLLEESIERLLLANSKLARLNTRVIHTQEGVHVVHRLCTDVGEFLDFGSGILDLQCGENMRGYTGRMGSDLVVVERKAKLLYTRLDSIPASQTVSRSEDEYVSRYTTVV